MHTPLKPDKQLQRIQACLLVIIVNARLITTKLSIKSKQNESRHFFSFLNYRTFLLLLDIGKQLSVEYKIISLTVKI